MIQDNQQQSQAEKKRVLRKVRANHLHRRPDDEENTVVPVPKPINPHTLSMIDGSCGLIEKNRKILLGVRYLNSHLKISNIQIDDHHNSKRVVLNIGKPDPSRVTSWEYSTKRLESYGNLELATWAHKIRNFYEKYPKVMQNYYRMIQSQDMEANKALEVTKANILKTQREIESKYPYQKVSIFYGSEKKELVSISLNQSILQEFGQTPSEFAEWAKMNGIPAILDGDCKVVYEISKYLDFPSSKIEGIEEGEDHDSYFYDVNGCKRKVVFQYVKIREPLPHGILISIYVLVKSSTPCEDVDKSRKQDRSEGVKCRKEGEEEVEVSSTTQGCQGKGS